MSITAVILAGGLGTRIQGVLPNTPKTLAPVSGEPFITRLFDQLLDAGVTQAILCTGHLGEQVRQRIGLQCRSLSITYSLELRPLGTAGALRNAYPAIKCEKVLVMNGDSCVATPLRPFIERDGAAPDRGAMILTWMENCSRYGTVEIGDQDILVAFHEKQREACAGWINAGVYLLPASWIAQLTPEVELSLEREVLPEWSSYGISVYKTWASFIDIGTPETLDLAESFFRQNVTEPPVPALR